MTTHWSKKLDPYWSIENMMKTNKTFFYTLAAVNNSNAKCYVIQSKNAMKEANSVCYRICRVTLNV